VADDWCWFVLREGYCWLFAGGWFVVREKYCWLLADKPSERGQYSLVWSSDPGRLRAARVRCGCNPTPILTKSHRNRTTWPAGRGRAMPMQALHAGGSVARAERGQVWPAIKRAFRACTTLRQVAVFRATPRVFLKITS
jgi:hypothetical protein